ncbi:plasmid partitioning protein RepB [Brucellaceae bacterium C25G]
MARKNLFDIKVTPPTEANEPIEERTRPLGRPLMGLGEHIKPSSPVGAISQSLENISVRATRANEIEKKLAEGQTIVELDPQFLESSFVVDRLGVELEDQQALIDQIKEHGQQVPILVRPHPDKPGFYQVAYGHRRLAAIKTIGGKIKAVVRDLNDEQLVVSQGQENNARTDLSFIERCFFSWQLEQRGFSRDVIMSSLGVDKAALSRMISLVERLPAELIQAIGAAPSFGRQRWAELADLLDEKPRFTKAKQLIEQQDFGLLRSDDRFIKLYETLKTKNLNEKFTRVWTSPTGVKPLKITETNSKITFVFDRKSAGDFASYIEEQMSTLFDEYSSRKMSD